MPHVTPPLQTALSRRPASVPETGFPGILSEHGHPGGQDAGLSGRTTQGERFDLLVLKLTQ